MHIGTLSKVIGIQEDSKSALKSKIKNRAYKDPGTSVATVFDGTSKGFESAAKKMLPSNLAAKYSKFLDKVKEGSIKAMQKIDRQNGIPESEIKQKDYEKQYEEIITSDIGAAALFDPVTKIIGVADYPNLKKDAIITPEGNINFDSKILTHERQHQIQDMIKDEYLKSKNKGKKDGPRAQEFDNNEIKNKTKMSRYTNDPLLNHAYYTSTPNEFDANAAAERGSTSAGPGTVRASLQIGNQWPGRQLNVKLSHGEDLDSRINNALRFPPKGRVKQEQDLQKRMPQQLKEKQMNTKNKPSTTPIPKKMQTFIGNMKKKVDRMNQNSHTLTDKDLENAQPLRQNPTPRKQR